MFTKCLLIINEYSKSCLHYLEFVQNEPVDVISDADESMSGNSPSSPTSETAEDGGISWILVLINCIV